MTQRALIVNADDFGLSDDVNRGIAMAHEQGILSSASLMVTAPSAAEAAAYSKSHAELSLGIHIDLGCWIYRDGKWVELYHVVSLENRDAVAGEITRQLDLFRSLAGRNPTHVDSHQHVHRNEPVRSILLDAARDLNVPVRHLTPALTYNGSYYGQTREGYPLHDAISVEALVNILISLPPGVTELGCHPALGQNTGDPVYNGEREQELRTLCDPRIRRLLDAEGIALCSFTSIGSSWVQDRSMA